MFERLQTGLSTLRSVARSYGLIPGDPPPVRPRPRRSSSLPDARRPEAAASIAADGPVLDRSVESIRRYMRDTQLRARGITPTDPRAGLDRQLRDRRRREFERSRGEDPIRERELLASRAERRREDVNAIALGGGPHHEADPPHDEEKIIVGDIYERVDASGKTHTHVMLAIPSRSGKAQRTLEAIAATGTVDRDQANAYAGDLHRSELAIRNYDPRRRALLQARMGDDRQRSRARAR